MIELLKKIFDDYTVHARIMPVLVVALPIILNVMIKGVALSEWNEVGWIALITITLLSFFYRLTRDFGKKCENCMVQQLGCMPTTMVLRFSDSTINPVSKQKYHERINSAYGLSLPLQAEDEQASDDDQYDAAAISLKNRANFNRDTEFRVYQELKEYHFYRNLLGIKPVALLIYSVLAVIELWEVQAVQPKGVSIYFFAPFLVLIFSLIAMCFVTENGMKARAFSYARTLIEICERLND